MRTKMFLSAFLLALPSLVHAEESFVQWSLEQEARQGTEVYLRLNAQIEKGYHLYALKNAEVQPTATVVKVSAGQTITQARILQKQPREIKNLDLGDSSFVFEKQSTFPLLLSFAATENPAPTVRVNVRYSVCTDRVCFPPVQKTLDLKLNPNDRGTIPVAELTKNFQSVPTALSVENPSTMATAPVTSQTNAAKTPAFSLSFLLLALGLGLASVLTPCVFPMLPITVSFFLRQHDTSSRNRWKQVLLFGGGIVFFFCGLGLLVTLVQGPFALTQLSAHPAVNIGIGVVLVGLGLSLLGLWELSVPNSLLLRLTPRANQMNAGGILLMGFTLTVTSFACIGPFMGTLLASTLGSTDIWKPTLGMGAYSMGLAAPFMFFALFPSFLQRLPKSGNWLLKVKATFGVLVILFSAKYFYNAYNIWNIAHGRALFTAEAKCNENLWTNNHSAAVAHAQKSGQNVLLSFHGYACTNCHWMKEHLLSQTEVKKSLDTFVISELFTDGGDATSEANQKIEQSRFQTVALPFYAIINANDEVVATFSGLTRNRDEFLNFLKKGEMPAKSLALKERDPQCLN